MTVKQESLLTKRRDDQFVLRLPGTLRDQIKIAAACSGRSMNAEILHRITHYDQPAPNHLGADLVERLERAVAKLEAPPQMFKPIGYIGIASLDLMREGQTGGAAITPQPSCTVQCIPVFVMETLAEVSASK